MRCILCWVSVVGFLVPLTPALSTSPPLTPPLLALHPCTPCGQHMREAAERRQQLELEHEQALAVLNAKQQEIEVLQKVRELRLLITHSTRGLGFLVWVTSQRAFC